MNKEVDHYFLISCFPYSTNSEQPAERRDWQFEFVWGNILR